MAWLSVSGGARGAGMWDGRILPHRGEQPAPNARRMRGPPDRPRAVARKRQAAAEAAHIGARRHPYGQIRGFQAFIHLRGRGHIWRGRRTSNESRRMTPGGPRPAAASGAATRARRGPRASSPAAWR
ncbi:hypothetical protein F7R25_19050, partial [Burkholderia stagnalis]